jgi:endonuclease G
MKQILAIVVTIFVMMGSALASINERCPEFTAHGAPTYQAQPRDQQLCRQNYAVIHGCSVKNPLVVMERVTPAAVSGPAKRRDDFRPDPQVHAECRSTLQDYAGAGYDRGHLAPAANNTQTTEIMSESFLLSNMIPQVPNNNRGIWRILELQVRDQVRAGATLYVMSGAIYRGSTTQIGQGVAVPTHIFKIIINKNTQEVTAYLMPNAPLPVADLPRYRTTVAEVERMSGMKFPVR